MRGRLRRALGELAVTIERGPARWRPRPGPGWPGRCPTARPGSLASLHDPDARPIRKGRIDRPVEFGYKAQVTGNDDGIILDLDGVQAGNAPRTLPGSRRRSAGSRGAPAAHAPFVGHRRPRVRRARDRAGPAGPGGTHRPAELAEGTPIAQSTAITDAWPAALTTFLGKQVRLASSQVTARHPNYEEAAALALPSDASVLVREDIYQDRRGNPVDFTRTVWPGDTTRLVIDG